MIQTSSTDHTLRAENAELRARLEEAEEMLRAIRAGEVDALMVEGDAGPRLFTLQGADAEQTRLRSAMLAQVSDAVIAEDIEERVTFLNAAAERQYGVRAGEVLGCPLTEIFNRRWLNPEDEAGMRTALSEHGAWRGELIHSRRDGSELYVESSRAVLHDPDTGERIGLVTAIRDITERKKTETALVASEAKVRAQFIELEHVYENAPVGLAIFDRDLRYLRINERLADINGLPAAEHLGRTIRETLPSIADAIYEVRAQILVTGCAVEHKRLVGETPALPGVTRSWSVSWFPVRCERGEIIGFGVVVAETTMQDRAEVALRLANERLTLAVMCSQVVLFQQDMELRYTWLENAVPGFDDSHAIGKRDADLMERAADAVVTEALKREVIRSGVSQRQEIVVQIAGVDRHYDLLVEPLRDAAGLITGITGAAIDTTERKQAEQALAERTAQLHRQSLLIDLSYEPIFIWSADDGILSWNKGCEHLYGYTEAAALGRKSHDLLKTIYPVPSAEFVRTLERDGSWTGELRHTAKDGRQIIIESRQELKESFGKMLVLESNRDITARKQAEERLQLAITGSDLGTWHWDICTGELDWSERCLKIFGLPSDTAMTYEKFLGALHPEDRARAEDAVQRALQDGSEYRIEFRSIWPDGSVHWVVSIGRAYYGAAGELTRMEGIALDITERKQAEQTLAERTELLNGVLEGTTDVIYVKNLDGRLLLANAAFAAAARSSPEQLVGKTDEEWFPPDVAAAVRQQDEAVIAGGSPMQFEDTLPVAGEARVFLTLKAPLRDGGGRVLGILGISRDITERKQAEEALRESEEQFKIMANTAPAMIWVTHPDATLKFISRGWLDYTGQSETEAFGKEGFGWLDAVHPEDVERSGQVFLDANARNVPFSLDYRIRRPNGEYGWAIDSGRPRFDDDGHFLGYVGSVTDVHERKQAEEALGARTDELETLLDTLPGFVWIARDAECRVIVGNRTANEFVGVDVGANVSQSVVTTGEAPYLRQIKEDGIEYRADELPLQRAMATGLPVRDAVLDFHFHDGRRAQVVGDAVPLFDEQGRIRGGLAVFVDITERKQADAAIRESEERLQKAISVQNVGVLFFKLDGHMLDANGALVEMSGYTAEELRRITDWAQLTPPEFMDVTRRAAAELAAHGVTAPYEKQWIRKDGSRFWGLFSPTRLSGSGSESECVEFTIDITERKRAEEELRESESKLRDQLSRLALLEQITRGISSHLDFQHILKVVTNHLEDHLPVDFCCVCLFDEQAKNYEVAKVGTKSMPLAKEMAMLELAVISWECDATAQTALAELKYLPDVREIAFPLPQRLAKCGLISMIQAPLHVEGYIIGFLLVARRAAHSFADGECEFLQQLSEHVALSCRQARLHRELQTAHDDLRRTQQTTMQRERLRALGQMACGITHDISNAISPVTLYTASLLAHEKDLSVRARNSLQTIHRAVHNVTETITRMREFCRQGEAQMVLSPIQLNHVAQQALDLTRVHRSDSPHERGIVIQSEILLAEDLSDIMGVESEIRDAIVNLILNAVDAMPGGGTLTLRTVNQKTPGNPEARQACLELMDTGIGMDEDTRRRCLEPFFTTKGEHGSGMGLAMVYGMISRHRAGIDIESASCLGTTVRMRFPVIESASRSVYQPLQTNPAPAIHRILFIDDDPLLIESMRDTLEADGHTVVTAAGGQEGIHAFIHALERNEAFTVVITDLGMPHVDGRKVAGAVKAASPSTPVILLTGWGQRIDAEAEIRAQVDRLLCKPPNLIDLREALAACCPPEEFKLTIA